jgi:hypothetical protein
MTSLAEVYRPLLSLSVTNGTRSWVREISIPVCYHSVTKSVKFDVTLPVLPEEAAAQGICYTRKRTTLRRYAGGESQNSGSGQ